MLPVRGPSAGGAPLSSQQSAPPARARCGKSAPRRVLSRRPAASSARKIAACSRCASTDAAARASSPPPRCSRSPRFERAGTRRRSRPSAPSAPARRFCVLPHRRQADPGARADRRAGRADRPGPDAAAPGRRVRGLGADGYILDQHQPHASTSSGSASSRSGFAAERLLTVPATEHRARAPRPPASRTPCCSAASPRSAGSISLESVAAAIAREVPGRDRRRQHPRPPRPRTSSSSTETREPARA